MGSTRRRQQRHQQRRRRHPAARSSAACPRLTRNRARSSDSPVEAARARGIKVSLESEPGGLSAPTEINVIGRTVDEATSEVEKFVDRAFLAGLPRVRIVHGSGMGILRKALREYLKKHPHVETVAEAPQNEGGGGATIAELKA